MFQPVDHEMRAWMDDWKTTSVPLDPPANIRRHIRRRSALLAGWKWSEIAMCAGFFLFLVHRAGTGSNPFDRAAMGALAVISLGALFFTYWNWQRIQPASTETIARLLDLSLDRCRRLHRAVRFGWALLISETAVFIPWIWYRTRSRPNGLWPWGLLGGMVLLAILFLVSLEAWGKREVRAIESLKREVQGPIES